MDANPVFFDVESDSGLIDVSKVENAITPKTKAMIHVLLYGTMTDMKSLRKVADEY